MHGFVSIPFKTDSGLSQVNGVAKFSSAGIVLEFESKLFGLISNGVKEARIAVGDVHDVKFKKGFMKRGASIEIRLSSFAQLAKIPHKEGKIVLKLASDDFERARDAVARLNTAMEEHVASLPPPATSFLENGEDETKNLNDE